MKQSLIIILFLLSACSPKNANLPVSFQQDTEPYTDRENLAKFKKQVLTEIYSTSSKGEINLNAEKGNAYVKWDEQGMTMFLSRDFVPSPNQKGAEKLNRFIMEFRQSVYSNSEGKMYIPGTDVSFQIDGKGIAFFIPKTEGVEAYYSSGVAHHDKGQYDEAISDFTKALEISPKFADARYYRGITYVKKGRYDEAISDYNKTLEINPKYALAYYARGSVYSQFKGQYDQAISDYSKALELNPRFGWTYVGRGTAYYKKGQYDEAILDYTKALEMNPTGALTYYNRGMAYADKGQYDLAISDYTKALEIDSRDSWTYYNRGIVYEKSGQYDQAISDYKKALKIDPKCMEAYNNLAWVLATANLTRSRNGEKALKFALKACELTDWKNPACLDTLAAAYAREGDFENAVKWQEKALESAEPAKRADYRERLESYKQRKPWPSD